MRPRYLLAASLAVAVVSTALLPSAAGAGTITKDPSKATHVIPCNDGSGKSARLWFAHTSEPTGEYLGNVHYRGDGTSSSWAADNPCTKWMVMRFSGDSESDPYGSALSVAPRAHFQRSSLYFYAAGDWEGGAPSIRMSSRRAWCSEGYNLYEVRRYDSGRFRQYKVCPGADDRPLW